jgi:hypothetical protein
MRTILIGLILIAQLSCSDENSDIHSFTDDLSITTLNGRWRVISFEDFTTNTVEYQTQENSWDKDIIVTFNDALLPKLLSGEVTTNSVHGEFDYVGPRQFKLNKYETTFVAQPSWADKFGTAVNDNTATFKINSDKLRIYYSNNTKSVTLAKER